MAIWILYMATFGPEIGFTPLTPAFSRPPTCLWHTHSKFSCIHSALHTFGAWTVQEWQTSVNWLKGLNFERQVGGGSLHKVQSKPRTLWGAFGTRIVQLDDGRVWTAKWGRSPFVTASLIGWMPHEVHAISKYWLALCHVKVPGFLDSSVLLLPPFVWICWRQNILNGTNKGVIPLVPSSAQKCLCDVD